MVLERREGSAPRSRGMIVGLVLATSAYVLEIAVFPLLLPEIQHSFELTRRELTWIVNVYAIAVAGCVLLAGWLGDKVGRFRIFGLGVVCFCAGTLAAAAAESFAQIFAARLAQGIGAGLFSPLIPVLLVSASRGRPGRFLALWNSFSGFVVAAAPLGTAGALDLVGWHVVLCALVIVALPSLFLVLPNGNGGLDRPVHAQKAMPVARALPGRPELFAYVAMNYGSILLFLFMAPLHIQKHGGTGDLAALGLGLVWACFTAVGLLIRNRIDGRHIGLFLLASPVCVWLGFASLIALPNDTVWVAIAGILIGTGFAFGNAPSTTLILRHAGETALSLAASLDITCARLGSALAIALIGPLESGLAVLAGVGLLSALTIRCALPFRRSA